MGARVFKNAAMTSYTLITGASQGIGLALAHRFAAQGKSLIITARNQEALEAHRQELTKRYAVDVVVAACDLSNQAGLDSLIAQCEPYAIEGLVNNAGHGTGGDLHQQDVKELQGLLFLNITALTLLTRHFVPQLIERRGTLLNVSSQAAFQAIPHFASYAASKAYVLHLTEALYQELKPKGVRVLALCPGPVATAFWQRAKIDPKQTRMVLGTIDQTADAAMRALKGSAPFVLPGISLKAVTFLQRFVGRNLCTKVAGGLMGEPKGH
jgi:short-subunit dehydrogenase